MQWNDRQLYQGCFQIRDWLKSLCFIACTRKEIVKIHLASKQRHGKIQDQVYWIRQEKLPQNLFLNISLGQIEPILQ